ncbi:uncharacterized protein [Watersipora subatra]|uniref:uncharacterized protein n=1 Tax=Watersipora subatra TaxID=2589382 RepID=UPI00355B9556
MGSYYVNHSEYPDTDLKSNFNSRSFRNVSQQPNGPTTQTTTQGLLDDNVCYANIRRGLGFEVSTPTDGNSDDWTSRARASPVVERLIFQELQSNIIEAAQSIGVALDPRQWGLEDTLKWLQWVANLYHISDVTNCLSFDGATLCGFSEEDFIFLTGTKEIGQKIAAQLDLWKRVTGMTPSTSSYQFQQQPINQKPSMSNQSADNTSKLMDGNWWEPQQQQFSEINSTNQFASNLGSDNFSSLKTGNSLMMGSKSDLRSSSSDLRMNNSDMNNSSSFQLFNSPNQQLPFDVDQMQSRNTPRPTIPLDRFRSVRESFQNEGFLPWQKYQELTSMTPGRIAPPNTQTASTVMFATTSGVKEETTVRSATATFPLSGIEQDDGIPATSAAPPPAESDNVITNLTSMGNEMLPEYPEVNLLELKTETIEGSSAEAAMDTLEPQVPADKPAKKKSAKHPIHLWEFLRQLLQDGKECIRWIDHERGVFKIYNSQEVAKLWGERKNRPAMNYDKLSRSIRQYYKKGIIKKTSQGKRLVYQFCEGYL